MKKPSHRIIALLGPTNTGKTFIAIDKMGASFIPKLFELKRKVDLIAEKFRFLPNKLSDRLMQFLSNFWPNHLPPRMEQYRDQYEHHWVIEMSDEGVDEAKAYFEKFFSKNDGNFLNAQKKKLKKHSYIVLLPLVHKVVIMPSIKKSWEK